MKNTTLKKIHLFYLIALFVLAINTISAQGCIVYDDLTLNDRQTLGINEQVFQAYKTNNQTNSVSLYSATPIDYPLTPKKFRIQFWSVQNNNGQGIWVPYNEAVAHVKILNSYYKDYNICFVLTGVGALRDNES